MQNQNLKKILMRFTLNLLTSLLFIIILAWFKNNGWLDWMFEYLNLLTGLNSDIIHNSLLIFISGTIQWLLSMTTELMYANIGAETSFLSSNLANVPNKGLGNIFKSDSHPNPGSRGVGPSDWTPTRPGINNSDNNLTLPNRNHPRPSILPSLLPNRQFRPLFPSSSTILGSGISNPARGSVLPLPVPRGSVLPLPVPSQSTLSSSNTLSGNSSISTDNGSSSNIIPNNSPNSPGFTLRADGKYIIDNPLDISRFWGPDGEPNTSLAARKVAGNIAKAMEYKKSLGKRGHGVINLDPSAARWLEGFMVHNCSNPRRGAINSLANIRDLKMFSENESL
jgi:hypothetical protein